MNRQTVFRIALAVVAVAVLVLAGVAVFNAGAAYGLAQADGGADGAFSWMPGMAAGHRGLLRAGHMGWGFRPFGGFGFLGCLVPLFFLFLVFWLIRGAFWRGPWGWRGHRGGWHGEGVPPHFEEWHRRAHGEAPRAGNPAEPPPPSA